METTKYIVILRDGENAGKEQYFSTTKEKLDEIFDGFRLDVDGVGSAQIGYIAGNDTKHGEKEDILEINKKTGLLKLTCNNEITANKCAAYFKLPLPFPYTN